MAKRLEAIEIRRYKPPLNDRNERINQHILFDAVDFLLDGFWLFVTTALALAIAYAL